MSEAEVCPVRLVGVRAVVAFVVLKIVAFGGVVVEKLVATESGMGVFTEPDSVVDDELSPNSDDVMDFVALDNADSPSEKILLTDVSASDTIFLALEIILEIVEDCDVVVVAVVVLVGVVVDVNKPITKPFSLQIVFYFHGL